MYDLLSTVSQEALQIITAIILGGLIGFERELKQKAVGLRTTILICLGSTLFMMISTKVAVFGGPLSTSDPARIAAGVVTGIGFLGAGAVLREGGNIHGLTTAAVIWVVGAIGLSIGCGHYRLAIGSTLAILFVLLALGRVEGWITKNLSHYISR